MELFGLMVKLCFDILTYPLNVFGFEVSLWMVVLLSSGLTIIFRLFWGLMK